MNTSTLANANPPASPPYYVSALALGIPAILLGFQIAGWIGFARPIHDGHADFRQLYTAGYMLRSGHRLQLYDYDAQLHFQNQLVSQEKIALPFIRPAYMALLFVPFSLLRYRAAYLAFLALNVALLVLCFRMLRSRMAQLAEIYRWLPPAMLVLFLPVAAALMQGQDSILLLTLLTAALLLLEQDRQFLAGVMVGLGVFKFQIVIPIAVLFLIWKHWRFCAGSALSGSAAGFVSLGLVGRDQAEIYIRSLVSMGAQLPAPATQLRYPVPISRMANLHGLVAGSLIGRIPRSWIQLLTLLLSGVVLLAVARARRTQLSGADSFLLAVTTSAVVSYYLLFHDLSVLLLPLVLTLDRFIVAEASGDVWGRRAARSAALMFVAPVCISYIPDHFFLVALLLLAFLFVQLKLTNLGPTEQAFASGV